MFRHQSFARRGVETKKMSDRTRSKEQTKGIGIGKIRFLKPTAFAVEVVTHENKSVTEIDNMKAIRIITLTACLALTAVLGSARAETKDKDIVAVASSAGSFNTLVAAVKAAGLVETLQGPGPFTVFAPTDEAFAKLPKGTLEDLLKPENKSKLTAILTYHVLPGKVMAADVKTMKAKTVNGQELNVKASSKGVTVDDAKVVKTDIATSNGVIHVIDTVVLPK